MVVIESVFVSIVTYSSKMKMVVINSSVLPKSVKTFVLSV